MGEDIILSQPSFKSEIDKLDKQLKKMGRGLDYWEETTYLIYLLCSSNKLKGG